MVEELTSRLMVADNSSVFTNDRKIKLIKDAYIWVTQQYIWKDLVRAKTTKTQVNHQYYDYPSEFISGSIVALEIDGKDYSEITYESFIQFKRDYPNSDDRYFANFGRYFFVTPTPTAEGTANISAWGAIQADSLDDNDSVTIFSYNKQSGNEAVVEKALSVATERDDRAFSKDCLSKALNTIIPIARTEAYPLQRAKQLNKPMFNVPDYLGNNGNTPIGRFNYSGV